MKRCLLLGTAALAALSIGAAGVAHASPYAFASMTFDDFLITLGSGMTASGGQVSVTTSTTYPGGVTGPTASSTYGGTSNPVETTYSYGGPNAPTTGPGDATGPSQAPVLPSFAPSLNGGMGAFAGASVGGSNVYTSPGDGAYMVVGNGAAPIPPASISATASQVENVYSISTGSCTSGCTVEFSFKVQAYSYAQTTQLGETASASTGGSITEYLCTAGGTACTSSSEKGIFSPPQVTTSVSQTAGPGSQSFGDPSAFSTLLSDTFTGLAPDSTYEFILAASVTETTKSVPEPASLALLGTALLGLGGVARRRRKS